MTNPTSDTEPTDSNLPGSGADDSASDDSELTGATVISRLDRETIERIAAGEVVTRPASVVTELVENSLDAGASTVSVAVEEGGKCEIRVADDGHGMSSEDAVRAVDRHTTSKISGREDVDRVSTLGFRGEALSAVARMSRLSLTTKAGGVRGTRVTVNDEGEGKGGKEASVAGRDVGTTVTVRDLFYNTPARRKSLASTKREFAAISEAVTWYALCRPDVRFRLEHDGREVFTTPGAGRYTDAVLGTYGRDVASQSTEITAENEAHDGGSEGGNADEGGSGIGVTGLLVYPSVTRATVGHVHTAINGRAVGNETVRNAVLAGYGSLLPSDRYPVAVLDVSIPPEGVDVNVHPTKAEVALRDPTRVGQTVEKAVRETLRGADLSRVSDIGFDLDSSLEPVEGESVFEACTVIGQFRRAYLLCEANEDLLVIDQHAAHERINYERLHGAIEGSSVESVPVDPPATVVLSPTETAVLDAERASIEALGFGVEPVGGGICRVTDVPAPFGRVSEPAAIRDVLSAVGEGERNDPDDPREGLLKTLACHPSLKAGDELSDERVDDLLAQLGACEQPFACPHGRPTVLSIDERAFVRGFERPSRRLG